MATTSTRDISETRRRPSGFRWYERSPVRWFCPARRALIVLGCIALFGIAGWWAGWRLWADYQWRQAEKAIEKYDFRAARQHLESYLWVRPKDGAGHFLMARTCRRMQDYLRQEEHLQSCRRLRYDPEALELEELLFQAQSGNLRAAESRMLALLEELHPQEVLILEALVKGLLQTHRLREAHRWASVWFDRHPEDWQALLWRALSSEMARQNASAIIDLRKALEINPTSDEIHLRLADVLFAEGQFSEAAEHYDIFDQLVPETEQAGEGLVRLGQCLRSQGEPVAARAALDRLFARRQDLPGAFLLRAQLDMDEEKFESALVWLRKAEPLAPEDLEIAHTLALVLRRLQHDEEAAKYESKVREVRARFDRLYQVEREILGRPNDLALRVEAGKLLLALRREKEALRWLLSARQQDPNYRPMHAGFAEYYERAGKPAEAAYHRRLAGTREGPGGRAASP
jgi:tetratricopeptide (TPR) repeat protein